MSLSLKNFEVEADDLVAISELGRGAYGVVEKVRHAQSGTIMAVKVRRAGAEREGGWDVQLQGSGETLRNPTSHSKTGTVLFRFCSLCCPWWGLAVGGSVLIPAGHCGVVEQVLKAGLVPAGRWCEVWMSESVQAAGLILHWLQSLSRVCLASGRWNLGTFWGATGCKLSPKRLPWPQNHRSSETAQGIVVLSHLHETFFLSYLSQRIRATVNTQEQKRLLMDLDISMRTVDCFYTVTFYGALFREVLSRWMAGGLCGTCGLCDCSEGTKLSQTTSAFISPAGLLEMLP